MIYSLYEPEGTCSVLESEKSSEERNYISVTRVLDCFTGDWFSISLLILYLGHVYISVLMELKTPSLSYSYCGFMLFA